MGNYGPSSTLACGKRSGPRLERPRAALCEAVVDTTAVDRETKCALKHYCGNVPKWLTRGALAPLGLVPAMLMSPARRDRVPDRLRGLEEAEEAVLGRPRVGDLGLCLMAGQRSRRHRSAVEGDAPRARLGPAAGAEEHVAGLLQPRSAGADAAGRHDLSVHLPTVSASTQVTRPGRHTRG